MKEYNSLWNITQPDVSLEDLKMDARMIWLLFSLLSTLCWVIYITFYNSRVVGLLLTRIINKWLLKEAFFKVGSLTINVLAGKIMFRDVAFICFDYSIRIQDGYIIFRWWRSYVPKDISEDLSHSDTRLSVTVNGFEIHTYNRSKVYDNLERVFGFTQSILMAKDNMSADEFNSMQNQMSKNKHNRQSPEKNKMKKTSIAMTASTWRDLIPVIKIDICCGRLVAGNRLTPTTLSISVEEAHCVYSTKPAACYLDHFMHFVKAKIENAKVLFAPSLKYTGLADEPPRYMGEGFVVMMSNSLEVYFYMDEPGIVPEEPVHLTLANGDVVDPAPPVWGIDIKCGKGTDFSYGPWADRQRDQLFRFFFPPDWQEMPTTCIAMPGERRQYQSFDISLCTLNEATVDILFSKEKETNAMHVTIGAGSYIEVTIPWTIQNDGFKAVIYGQLLHMEATTSLQYRSLAECESLEYNITMCYPKRWNESQDWNVNLTGYKATAYIIYKHKLFFQDLIEDWSSKSRSDILTFVPYTCKISAVLKEFEILTISNEFNWIDCSSANQENHHLAFCGDLVDLSFILPFNDFLPKTVTLKFWIHGEGLDLSMFLPEVSTSRSLVLALEKNSKILSRSGNVASPQKQYTNKWRRICLQSNGWIDCWSVPIIILSIQYIYHPIPPLGPDPQADITTPEKEEILLSPMRIPSLLKSPAVNWRNADFKGFDPAQLENDQITVDLELGSSTLMAYGSLLRQFVNLKENLFGEDQLFQDMDKSNVKIDMQANSKDFLHLKDQIFTKEIRNRLSSDVGLKVKKTKPLDPRVYRPLEVVVSVMLHDVQAHLLKNAEGTNKHCPTIFIERIGFEMRKKFMETELQVLLSPSYLLIGDTVSRQFMDKHLNRGHLLISAIQVRGHAMFSNAGRNLDEETLEYAWLLEAQIGKISGKITLPQLCDVVIALESFIFLVVDPENRMRTPKNSRNCYHGVSIFKCSHTKTEAKYQCPSVEDIKYKMTRISIDVIDVYFVESGIALNFWVSPIRVGTCNLHGQNIKSGISGFVSNVSIRMFEEVTSGQANAKGAQNCFRNYVGQKNISLKQYSYISPPKKEGKIKQRIEKKEGGGQKEANNLKNWLEVGCILLGPIIVESASAFCTSDSGLNVVQQNFLRKHDFKLKRLWFLWITTGSNFSKCGCDGGCEFFGNNGKSSDFFRPNTQNIKDNFNVIRYQILPGKKEFGFGESILHENQLVFHTPPYNLKTITFLDVDDIVNQLKEKNGVFQNVNKKTKSSFQWKDVTERTKANSSKSNGREKTSVLCDKSKNDHPSTLHRQSSIEVPYLRLQDNRSVNTITENTLESKTWDCRSNKLRRGSDFRNLKRLENRSPKTSISDSKLLATSVEYFDRSDIIPHWIPEPYPLDTDLKACKERAVSIDEKFINKVQRTVSLTSDNQSEIFFSADEDGNNISEYSTLLINNADAFEKRKTFLSDLSISVSKGEEALLAVHKSDLEICKPETKNLAKRPQSTTEIEGRHVMQGLATPLRKQKASLLHQSINNVVSSSESLSASSSSFISAMSSQEDISQRNSKIYNDSPLLMACYINLLPMVNCSNWNDCSFPSGGEAFSVSFFQENSDGGLAYIGNKMVPRFDSCNESKGLRVISKVSVTQPTCKFSDPWEVENNLSIEENYPYVNTEENNLISDGTTKTSFLVKLNGQADVTMTPLVFEALQRMVESLIPTVNSLEIPSIVHIMHSFCVSQVKDNNVLKRDANLSCEPPVNWGSDKSTTTRVPLRPGSSLLGDVHEEFISTKLQGFINLPKVNVIFLQSSVLKESLSCMTLLALRIEAMTIKFHSMKTAKASIYNVYTHPIARTNETHKKGGIMRGTKAFLAHLSSHNHSDNVKGEPVLIETSEKQLAELVVTIALGNAQVQMLRIKGEEHILKSSETSVTAIPVHRSKSAFECIRAAKENNNVDLGSIMFECGLESASADLIKRSNFVKNNQSYDSQNTMQDRKSFNNINTLQPQTAMNDGPFPKAESTWRLLSKRPPTPKMPKDKFLYALENIIPDKDSLSKDIKAKPVPKYNSSDSDGEKLKNLSLKPENEIMKESDAISSCIVDLNSVWFNFAAPPCVSKSKKNDNTRLDWNFLNTASATLTAWMNPSNFLAIKIVALLRAMYIRNTAAAVCLMADSLDSNKIHNKPKIKKTRYPACYTLLSKTLQDDPSCQICTIMQQHILEEGAPKYEEILIKSDVPHINILRQGIIVLCRQWKNILYNPILFEHQYRNKLNRPINSAITFKQSDIELDDFDCETDLDGNVCGNIIESTDDSENTFLLGGAYFRPKEIFTNLSEKEGVNTNLCNISHSPSNSQGLLKSTSTLNKAQHDTYDTVTTIPNTSKCTKNEKEEKDFRTLFEGATSSKNYGCKSETYTNVKDELYFWMAKQQENCTEQPEVMNHQKPSNPHNYDDGLEDECRDSIRLLDAHLIFEPFLTYLGVMPQQIIDKISNTDIPSLENLGTDVSLLGTLNFIRVDIVVSEIGTRKQRQRCGNVEETFNEQPAFLCENVVIELGISKKFDKMLRDATQNMIYISQRQLRKQTSTLINCRLNVDFISQQINMPLLRLLRQISTMYHTFKNAQNNLKNNSEQRKNANQRKDDGNSGTHTIAAVDNISQINIKPAKFASRYVFFEQSNQGDAKNFENPINNRDKNTTAVTFTSLNLSPLVKNRPQTFAQKLKSTGKTVKGKLGYSNLNDVSPVKDNGTSTLVPSNFITSFDSKKSVIGCNVGLLEGNDGLTNWKYKSYRKQESPAATPNCWNTVYQLIELYGTALEPKFLKRCSLPVDENEPLTFPGANNTNFAIGKEKPPISALLLKHNQSGHAQLIIFGIAVIRKTQLLATLSGLKLESEISTLNTSMNWCKKVRPTSLEYSLTVRVGRTMTVLLEGTAPNQQTVVKFTIGRSNALFSSLEKKTKDKNSGLVSIGPIAAEIPQHPVLLHGMMTRSSKKLSSTLQELGVGRTNTRFSKPSDEHESSFSANDDLDNNQQFFMRMNSHTNKRGCMQPFVMQFNVLLKSLSINAALLPSLHAEYKMTKVSSTGITGNKTKFIIDLPSHSLSFTTKMLNTEVNLPPEASLALPKVHICAKYIPESGREDKGTDGIILRRGGYVSALAEIGAFERCLTTDLLNHLVFVQKVFMKEVNEVLQKVYGSEKPVPLWADDSEGTSVLTSFLFSIDIFMKRIQLTATTPCSSAVRFETGTLELHFSNRVENIGKCAFRKWFGKAHIDLNLSLGQIIKNVIFDEAEPEFQQYAFFNTTVQLRNAFEDEVLNDNKELILLMLKRPLIYIQPIAVDKAILVWLNYKNAYEYWAEKRANLSNESYEKKRQMFEMVPFGQLGNIASTNLSALFLQLTVEDMGICLPLKQITWAPRPCQEFEPRNAVVITLESTIISACNSGSLVSKGKFQELCLRFADDFETTLDDWKPNTSEANIMNLCVVSEGTYEVCSHTIATKRNENAKWFLNVKWQMEGVDIHLDINIGKQLSSLGHTLTMLTGFEEEEDNNFESPNSDDGDQIFMRNQIKKQDLESLPSFIFDTSLNAHSRAIMMEKEMAEQLKIINDLRTLGASYNTVIHEERRLQELQALCYKYFRRDMIQKWKRSSVRRSLLKTKNRSQSFVVPSAKHKHQENLAEAITSTGSAIEKTTCPSRSASVRYRIPCTHRAKCSEAKRQTSLPSTETDMDFDDNISQSCRYESENLSKNCKLGTNYVLLKNTNQKQQEPNIDFELNIQVLINSGKCVLHTMGVNDEKFAVQSANKHHRRERSIGGNDWNSPTPSRKNRDKSKIKYNAKNNMAFYLTIFHIPGLDVKLFYESTTLNDGIAKCGNTVKLDSADISTSINRKSVNKRGSLFAWIILQSIPEETIISPHILEFLEQTLEPIPLKNDNVLPVNHVNIELLSTSYATYTSFPVDVIVYFHMQPSTFRFSCQPVSRVECMLQLPSLDIVFSSKRSTDDSENFRDVSCNSNAGGLSVTGCLADFNLYVFHPYGGKKSGLKEAHFSPLTDSERKDSLSVSVEFVKFHLTRCRKLHIGAPKVKRADNKPIAIIRFSTIVDIGSASFKYDMRRLTEILAFPKAWYRKTIVRRLFLGDISVNRVNQKECQSSIGPETTKDVNFDFNLAQGEEILAPSFEDMQIPQFEQNQEWETLVLFAVNFTKLNVQMNMGNVMGNVVWLTRDFQSDGKLSIGSTSYKNMHVGIRLGGSSLDAKGGIVGGIFDINDIGTQFHVKEASGKEPYHTIQSKLKAMEVRLDYMGTSILMGRISSFSVTVRDEWKTTNDENIYNSRKNAIIFIHGDLLWDQLQIMISKSTTADLLKIYFKLEEFFSQQFKSSKRVFFNLESRIAERNQNVITRQQQKKKQEDKTYMIESSHDDARHHRHWQKPLSQAMTFVVPSLATMLPIRGYILGGTIELHGTNISLACFNGINFKSKSWALFSLREPFINFATEAKYIGIEGESEIVETLAFSLGQNMHSPQTHSMAIVSRVTRNIVFPPQYKTLADWFHYTFANSELDAIDRFPIIDRDKDNASNSMDRSRGLSVGNSSNKAFHLNHNRDVIFALPSLQFHFKTEHKQGPSVPDLSGEKPVVMCSFITEFEDHIFVTVDADAFFFLHDLITSYVKEKERVIGAQATRISSPNSSDFQKSLKARSSNPTVQNTRSNDSSELKNRSEIDLDTDIERYIRDWRHFECKAWHLEPTVRLLSWAGKSIEPYGVDYILNKLGFSHARITIPKWLQRGFMDPLDKIQALMMLQLLALVRENRSESCTTHN